MKKLNSLFLATTLVIVGVLGVTGVAKAAPGAASSSPPSVHITEPWGLDEVAFDVFVRVDVVSRVGINRVDVFVDGERVGTDTTAPYTIIWDSTTSPNRFAWITATATDSNGQVGRTASATGVVVGNP